METYLKYFIDETITLSVKRVNIGISDKTHTQAKLISILKGITLNDYLKKAIEDAVNRDKELIKKLSE